MSRNIAKVLTGKPTIEGAGVHLKRIFGYHEVPQFDPFLMLDDFHSDNPDHYLAGFPWHPHRGIETVTYILHGQVRHGDSIGNRGVIQGGDIQWMTAGSGIIHQEMPAQADNPLLWGFQLWVNLPAAQKMIPPRYQDISGADVPSVTLAQGVVVKVLCGTVAGVTGPVRDIVADPEYLDVTVPAGVTFEHPVHDGYTVFAYAIEGSGYVDAARRQHLHAEHVALFERRGESVVITAERVPMRLLLISGKPIGETVAWHGPIVMNTQAELEVAFEEYQQGTFLKQTGGA
jgi:quercetin 2,3-dioxygenase